MIYKFDRIIREMAEEFDSIPTTEDPRVNIDRRCLKVKELPLADSKGIVIVEERRNKQRRSKNINIDDISDYDYTIH